MGELAKYNGAVAPIDDGLAKLKSADEQDLRVLALLKDFAQKLGALGCDVALIYGFDKEGKSFTMTGGALSAGKARDGIRKIVDLASK